jgi:hypothetical protein
MLNFGQFFEDLSKVRSFSDFGYFFLSQSLDVQVLMCIIGFGVGVLVWIFFWALFVDRI